MLMDRWLDVGWAAAVVCLACGPQVTVADTDSTAEDGSVGGDDLLDDGDGREDGGAIEGGSCAGLREDGRTVGGGDPGPSGFPPPCSPRVDGGPVGAYTCCSDDPAAQGGALPAFQGKEILEGATPLFSGANNALSTSGLCVKTGDIPAGSGLLEPEAAGCPIPCDPTWPDDAVATVCGEGRACCQTQPIERADCIVDPTTGLYRPVDGTDIGTEYDNGAIVTSWAPGEHATHQDPGGVSCSELAGGNLSGEVFRDCVRNLHVADRRGYCMALTPGQICPLVGSADACELLNEG